LTYRKHSQRKYGLERIKRKLATPRVIYHPPWKPPEHVVKEIKREFKENPNRKTASDTEAMVYLQTASLAAPLNEQACRIYFYLFRKYLKKKGWKSFKGSTAFLDDYKTLSDYDKRELAKLKDWIYKQQQKDLAERRKALMRQKHD